MSPTFRRMAALGAVIVLAAAVTLAFWQMAHRAGIARAEGGLDQRLQLYARAVESEIERFRALAPVLSRDARIVAALTEGGEAELAAANGYLEAVAGETGADALFIMDPTGLTIASSNHAEPLSFVGHNYRFRPYFLDALATGQGRYYAVGVTTGRPGYFLSSVIRLGERLIGVAIVKVDMAPLEGSWARSNPLVALADADGVVFLSGRSEWRYRTLAPLTTDAARRLAETRKYSGIDLAAAGPLIDTAAPMAPPATVIAEGLLFRTMAVPADGWQLLAATDLAAINAGAWLAASVALLLSLLSAAAVAYFRQRRQIVRAKLEQHDLLERAVAERTAELAREVHERRRAEQDLRAAQDSLVQAASLAALGRMSAAIVHEVSQPLAAIENTLATAGLHAERGDAGEAARVVRRARSLTERIQRTVRHLKAFARPDIAEVRAIDLARSVEAAIEIVAHRAEAQSAAISFEQPDEPVFVNANDIRIEQIAVNLVNNALDALAGTPRPVVAITVSRRGDEGVLTVADNGPGIDPAIISRMTEPFFSTKQVGQGLGLGLSICRAIVEKFGGQLRAGRSAAGGAEFTVTLPLASFPGRRRGKAA